MSVWAQIAVSLVVAAVATVLAALYVPAALPLIERAGLVQPLTQLGVLPPAGEAAPGGDGRAGAAPGDQAARGNASGAGAPGGGSAPDGGTRAGGGASPGGGAPGGGPPGGAGGRGGPPGGGGPTAVVADEPALRVMNDIVTAIGSARAARSVILSAEVGGRIVALKVASGDYVEAGTVVAELDDEAARIALDRAALVADDARATRDRIAQLRASGSATDLQTREAELALQTAELALREAEFDLGRHRITAPISGWVGILAADEGNRIMAGDEITRIDDRSSLIVDFRVPERVVSSLSPGDPLAATPLAEPDREIAGTIEALDNRVDEASRTLLVRAAIGNADDRLRPGMAFLISLAFTGDSHPAVDPLAIQWGSDGAYVWAVRDAKALRLPVRILQRGTDAVLIEADFLPGDLVVTEGVQALRPGADVAPRPADQPKT
jgi:RND family efflux transporter MFP subunit